MASDKYDVESLKNECVSALKNQLKINNAISMLVWAQFYSANVLFGQDIKFVVENCSNLSGQHKGVELMKNNRLKMSGLITLHYFFLITGEGGKSIVTCRLKRGGGGGVLRFSDGP